MLAVLTLLVQSIIGNVVRRVAALAENLYVRAAAGGALVGLIAFALPLTATGLPSDYTCAADCWWKIVYNYPGVTNDTTTWGAYIEGNPVSLVE